MKKNLPIALLLILIFSVPALADAPDLVFTKTEGKYIYCNNHEFIRRSDLADTSNEHPKYIMNNSDMTADKYSMFVAHVNHTELRDDNGTMTAPGFDIEVDVVFSATEDTVIEFTAAGFEVPQNRQYWYNGVSYTYEEPWGCFNCWATYLQMPIRQIDSGISYTPEDFEPVTVTIPAGHDFWISEIMPDYSAVPFFRPMNLMADFEIKSGKCDINVAALQSTGVVGDRSNFVKSSEFGSYDRDRQYKGIADSLNEVNAELSYEINDDTWSGSSLPVKVYNQKQPEGNEITKWYTHLNPRADQWSGDLCVESDMLDFEYYDPLKARCFGSKITDTDSVWHFDTRHSDTSEYSKEYGYSKTEYSPNWELTADDGTDYACNLGNYGVKLNYNIHITNSGDLTRYAVYKLSTSSNNVVYVRDENGELINGYALSKGVEETRVSDNMACVELPANKTTTFTVTVILTTNYSGGMQNELLINDTPSPAFVYDSVRQEIHKDESYTGREHYYWKNAKLYVTRDGKDINVSLPDSVKLEILGNWNEYLLYWTGNGYIMKPCLYDGIPYYSAQNFFKKVYFFDDDLNYSGNCSFDNYPKAVSSANGINYIYAGTSMYSSDNKIWSESGGSYSLPCWNYGKLSAQTVQGKIYLSTDGIDFLPAVYQSFPGSYIDSIGNIYYYADKKDFYYSVDGVYWDKFTAEENVSELGVSDEENAVLVNGNKLFIKPENENIIIKANSGYIGFDSVPRLIDGVTFAPLRFLCENLGAEVIWDNGSITISKDSTVIELALGSKTAYVNGVESRMTAAAINETGTAEIPVRWISETLGYTLTVNGNIIEIK